MPRKKDDDQKADDKKSTTKSVKVKKIIKDDEPLVVKKKSTAKVIDATVVEDVTPIVKKKSKKDNNEPAVEILDQPKDESNLVDDVVIEDDSNKDSLAIAQNEEILDNTTPSPSQENIMDDANQNSGASASQQSASSNQGTTPTPSVSSSLPDWLKPSTPISPVVPATEVSSNPNSQTPLATVGQNTTFSPIQPQFATQQPITQPVQAQNPISTSQPLPIQSTPVTQVPVVNQSQQFNQPQSNAAQLPSWLRSDIKPNQFTSQPASTFPQSVPAEPQQAFQSQPIAPVTSQPQQVPQVPAMPFGAPQSPQIPTAPFGAPQVVQAPQMPQASAAPFGAPQAPQTPAQPQKPYKPMTLADLAQQTPIFGADDLDFSKERRRKLREQRREEEMKKQAGVQPQESPFKPVQVENVNSESEVSQIVMPKQEESLKQEVPKEDTKIKDDDIKEEKKDEVINVEVVSSEEVVAESKSDKNIKDEEPLVAELKNKLSQTFKESNITKGQIFGCLSVIILIVVVIILIVYVIKWIFSTPFNRTNDIQKTEIVEIVEKPDEDTEVKPDKDDEVKPVKKDDTRKGQVRVDGSLYAGIMIANSTKQVNRKLDIEPSLEAGINQGSYSDKTGSTLFVDAVEHLQYMRKIYGVDLRKVLAESSDKVAYLNNHINELNNAISKAENVLLSIEDARAKLKEKYDAATANKDTIEKTFFENIQKYEGETAQSNLNVFIDIKLEQVDLSAQYKAWGSIVNYYEKYIPVLKTRLKDIEYNKDALIKGVQVYILENSEGLDLVIKVDSGL